MKQTNHSFSITILASAIAIACTPGVFAQTDSVEKDKKDMEIISVTATRRSQNISTVPYNISAVGGEALKQAGISSLGDLTKRLPGLSYTDRGARSGAFTSSIAMRGLSLEDGRLSGPLLTAPGVSTYVGETPLFANLQFYDIDRVEVLRGPQGTLYGSGSLGGTLRFIPNMPSFDGTEIEVSSQFGKTKNADGIDTELNAVFNFPLSDSLALRANIGRSDAAGWIEQPLSYVLDNGGPPLVADSDDFANSPAVFTKRTGSNDEQSTYARIAALWQPNDDFKATLAHNVQQDDSGGNPARAVNYQDLGEYDSAALRTEPYNGDTQLSSLDVEINLGFSTFTASVSTYDSEQEFITDVTGSYQAFAFYGDSYGEMPRPLMSNVSVNNDSANIAEMRFVSNTDSALGWVVGGFYMDQDVFVSSEDSFKGYSAWTDACAANVSEEDLYDNLVCGLGSNSSTFSLGMAEPGVRTNIESAGIAWVEDKTFLTNALASFKDTALFGELSWQIDERWQVTGGVRAFKQTFDNKQTNVVFNFDQVTVSQQSSTEKDVLFKFNSSYQLSDEAMLYFTRSEGFRRGGANALPDFVQNFGEPIAITNPHLLSYAPDEVINLEAGIKGQTKQFRYSLAAFDIEWKNIQLDTLVTPFLLSAVVNAGKAESKGLEAELNTLFDNGLDITLGYSFVNAKLADPAAEGLGEAGIDILTVKDIRLPGVPKHTASIDINYTQEFNDWYVIYGVNGSYRSDARSTLDPAVSTITSGYALWNGYVTFENDNWSFRLYVNNILNEEGVINTPHIAPSGPRRNELLSQPRSFGLNVKYSFL